MKYFIRCKITWNCCILHGVLIHDNHMRRRNNTSRGEKHLLTCMNTSYPFNAIYDFTLTFFSKTCNIWALFLPVFLFRFLRSQIQIRFPLFFHSKINLATCCTRLEIPWFNQALSTMLDLWKNVQRKLLQLFKICSLKKIF
jgi:hypothetical protein